MEKLFPQPYLQKGSKGPAVVLLQVMLFLLGYNEAIIPDGDYGEETAKGVIAFQRGAGIDDDGHFGPATRQAFEEVTGLDVNEIPSLEGEPIVTVTPNS